MTVSALSPGQATLPTPNSTKSFWHSEPSQTLLGHRTTSSLPKQADVVIIGSGISGASAAYHLNQDAYGKELDIVMLEAREACWGATGRVGLPIQYPIFRISFIERWNDRMVATANRCFTLLHLISRGLN
jgi:lysine/ornithine N-monooxygenase